MIQIDRSITMAFSFEMKKGELALEIIRGQAKQVDEYNLFDNALERVVMQIQANNQ